jgi:hypothetical protein
MTVGQPEVRQPLWKRNAGMRQVAQCEAQMLHASTRHMILDADTALKMKVEMFPQMGK